MLLFHLKPNFYFQICILLAIPLTKADTDQEFPAAPDGGCLAFQSAGISNTHGHPIHLHALILLTVYMIAFALAPLGVSANNHDRLAVALHMV